jgi:uncharacterized protein DUF4389
MEAAMAGTTTAQHPIRLINHDDLHRNRLTVFFRAILAIPLLLWWILWSVIADLAWFVNWWATLFMGRSPEGLHNFLATYLRFSTHLRAYVFLIANPYPGFTGTEGTYPIDLEVDPPARQSRWTVFFRTILAIPALLLMYVLSALSNILAVFSWFIALILGRVPEGIRNFAALALRIEVQTIGYLMLLTGRYPSFNVGIES